MSASPSPCFDTHDFAPPADGMFAIMDYGGLDFSEIIEELVDNSVDAGSSRIGVFLIPGDGGSMKDSNKLKTVCVVDDGCGMSETKLWNAIRFAYKHEHATGDIGKFGMGFNNATIALGDEIFILTKTADGTTRGLFMDINAMKRDKTYKPTRYCSSGETIAFLIPHEITDILATIASGTIVCVKSIKSTYAADVNGMAHELKNKMDLAYTSINSAVAIHTGTVESERSMIVTPIDVFYKRRPDILRYVGETTLRVYDDGTIIEACTRSRTVGCINRTSQSKMIHGTPEHPSFYSLSYQNMTTKSGRDKEVVVFTEVKTIPTGSFHTIKIRLIETTPTAYIAEGAVEAYKLLDSRRRGMWFYRDNRLMGDCLTLGEQLDDHSNRVRMEVIAPPELDVDMGVRTQKQMSNHLNNKALQDAIRIVFCQQLKERIRVWGKEMKAEAETASLSGGGADSSSDYSTDSESVAPTVPSRKIKLGGKTIPVVSPVAEASLPSLDAPSEVIFEDAREEAREDAREDAREEAGEEAREEATAATAVPIPTEVETVVVSPVITITRERVEVVESDSEPELEPEPEDNTPHTYISWPDLLASGKLPYMLPPGKTIEGLFKVITEYMQ